MSKSIRIRSWCLLGKTLFLDLLKLFPITFIAFGGSGKVHQIQVQILETKLRIAYQKDNR